MSEMRQRQGIDNFVLENAPLSSDAMAVVRHAFSAFGNEEKAWHWLSRTNPLLDGDSPIEILRIDPNRFELVDDELTRIEHGVFA